MQEEGFDKKCASAIIAYLSTFSELRKFRPRHWNDATKGKTPRIGVKVERGEELIYRSGVHRAKVEIRVTVRPKNTDNDADNLANQIEKILTGNPLAHQEASQVNGRFHFFAFESGGIDKSTDNDLRHAVIKLGAVGFEK